MKTLNTVYLYLLLILSIWALPQNMMAFNGGTKEVSIQTNAICGSCQNRIETALYKVPGVKSATLDLDTKVVTIKYKTSKTDPDALRQVIIDTGYDADTLKADEEARNSLPHCCVYGHD